MKIKVVFGSDIRRWHAPEENRYEALIGFVQMTFNFPNLANFFLQFEDDEGDKMTLSSAEDLNDAIVMAETQGRKSLKIFLIPVSIEEARQDALSQFGGSVPSVSDELNGFSEITEATEPPEPRTWQEELSDFRSNEAVNALLPDFVRDVMTLLRNQERFDDAVLQTASREEFESINQHPLFDQHVKTHLDIISLKIAPLLPVLLAFDTDHIVAIVPQLIETAVQMLSGAADAELDVTPIFGTLFPDWLETMNANNPDGATVDLSHIFGCADAGEAAAAMMRGAEEKDPADNVHRGITCDMCNVGPIRGVRYKCCVCSDFDLCGDCEATGTHNPDHPLLKLQQPRRGLARFEMHGIREMFHRGRCGGGGWRRGKWCGGRGRHHQSHHHAHHHRHSSRGRNGPFPKAEFVDDVNLPDGVNVRPGVVLEKVWRLKNTGETEWGDNCSLVFVKGCRQMTMEERFPIPNAAPGELVDVSAMIRTPDLPNRYIAYYRLERDGNKFGPRVWVEILVSNEDGNDERTDMSRLDAKQVHRREKLQRKQEKLSQKQAKVQAELDKLKEQIEVVRQQPEGPTLSCVCGSNLVKLHHGSAYSKTARVHCDICGRLARGDDCVFHCPNDFSPAHPGGYDMCEGCGQDQLRVAAAKEQDGAVASPIVEMQGASVEFVEEPEPEPVVEENATAPPAVEEEPAVEMGFPFQNALNMLMEMGFGDEGQVKQLLVELRGDIEAVVHRLVGSA